MTNFVHTPFTLWATGIDLGVYAGFLAYGLDAPDTVELVFPRHNGSGDMITFKVPRELLAAGLQHNASKSGITIRPHSMADWLVVSLPIDGQEGDFYADAVVVRAFLDATADLVPMDVAA